MWRSRRFALSVINDKCRIFALRDVKNAVYTHCYHAVRDSFKAEPLERGKIANYENESFFLFIHVVQYWLSSRFVFLCPSRHLSDVELASLLEVAPTTSAKNSTKNMHLAVTYLQFQIQVCFLAAVGCSRLVPCIRSRITFFSSCENFWPMTLTFELDLDMLKMNQRAKCLGQRSFSSNVIAHTHTIVCSTWTTNLVGIKVIGKYASKTGLIYCSWW